MQSPKNTSHLMNALFQVNWPLTLPATALITVPIWRLRVPTNYSLNLGCPISSYLESLFTIWWHYFGRWTRLLEIGHQESRSWKIIVSLPQGPLPLLAHGEVRSRHNTFPHFPAIMYWDSQKPWAKRQTTFISPVASAGYFGHRHQSN